MGMFLGIGFEINNQVLISISRKRISRKRRRLFASCDNSDSDSIIHCFF